jgi:hypothetical protein
LILRGEPAVLHAPMFDGQLFDDAFGPTESRRRYASHCQALVVALFAVVFDERRDLRVGDD